MIRSPFWIYLAASFLAGLVMVSSDSLWIDEGQTLHFARQPSIGAWTRALLDSTKSEALMPLGMFVAWVGGHLIGMSEWQLRSINLAWLSLAGLAIGLTGRRLGNRIALPLFLVHPFLWSYVNEARPYVMQICSGSWLLLVFVSIHIDRRIQATDIWLFGAAASIGYASNLLFAFPLAAFLIVAGISWRLGHIQCEGTPRCWTAAAISFLVLTALTCYFALPLSQGATSAKVWSVSPLNLGFAAYEALGFSGLGPPRIELRELARNPSRLLHEWLQLDYLPGAVILIFAYALTALRLWRLRHRPILGALFGVLIVSCILLYAASAVAAFPFWGRHLAPLLPVVTLILAIGIAPTEVLKCQSASLLATTLLLLGLAGSSLRLRFDPRHRRDDYRTACQLAARTIDLKKVVWWCAAPVELPVYYGVDQRVESNSDASFLVVNNPSVEQLNQWPAPDAVFLSKPDLFDWQDHVGQYLAAGGYRAIRRLPAFTIWIKPDSDLEKSLTSATSGKAGGFPFRR